MFGTLHPGKSQIYPLDRVDTGVVAYVKASATCFCKLKSSCRSGLIDDCGNEKVCVSLLRPVVSGVKGFLLAPSTILLMEFCVKCMMPLDSSS